MRRLGLFFLLALLVEGVRLALLARYPVHPDFLLGIVVLAALSRTSPRGAFIGFGLGLLRDLLYGNPIGFDAFPLALIGWVVASVGRSVYRDSLLTHIVVLFVAGLAKGLIGYVLLRGGELSGIVLYFIRITLPQALATALLVPVLWRWLQTVPAASQGSVRFFKGAWRRYEKKLLVKRS
jgi:rod shape-determining protein MreD